MPVVFAQVGQGVTISGDLKAAINTNRPWGAINRFDGYLPMPNGQPKLDECLIKRIGAWINAGTPE